MIHDPLCPALYPNVNGRCMCAFIAEVRADERSHMLDHLATAESTIDLIAADGPHTPCVLASFDVMRDYLAKRRTLGRRDP